MQCKMERLFVVDVSWCSWQKGWWEDDVRGVYENEEVGVFQNHQHSKRTSVFKLLGRRSTGLITDIVMHHGDKGL